MRTHHLAFLCALCGCSTSSSNAPVDASADDVAADTGRKDTGTDAELDAGFDSGEAAPGAGVVACGASTCTIPSEVCCPRANDAGACFPRDAAPCSPLECDQPDDCTGGTTCCYQFQPACADVSSTCKKTCASADVGACLGLTDCQTCVALNCAGLPLTTCGTDGVCCH